jgi:hypothetical protein
MFSKFHSKSLQSKKDSKLIERQEVDEKSMERIENCSDHH